MTRGYIYLISFTDTNDIYIGQTKQKNISIRFKQHKNAYGAIYEYV